MELASIMEDVLRSLPMIEVGGDLHFARHRSDHVRPDAEIRDAVVLEGDEKPVALNEPDHIVRSPHPRKAQACLAKGLKLPASSFRIQWYWRYEADECLGTCDASKRPIEISIARGQTEVETFGTLVHEFQHAADILNGLDATLDRAEKERRADAFSYACVVAEYGILPM